MAGRFSSDGNEQAYGQGRVNAMPANGLLAMAMTEQGGRLDAIVGSAVERLELLIDEETAALRHASTADLKAFNNRKAQVLMELDRAVTSGNGATPSPQMRQRLVALRGKLDANRNKLKIHLDAVQEVAGMLADQIRDADSDGTYTHGIRMGRR
jgi:hypothetical protein